MNIVLKRVYDLSGDEVGTRILVDRLWPRGCSREKLRIDFWVKELAPSDTLRNWYHENREAREGFREKYADELRQKKEALEALWAATKDKKELLFLYSSKEEKHNNAVVLKDYYETYCATKKDE